MSTLALCGGMIGRRSRRKHLTRVASIRGVAGVRAADLVVTLVCNCWSPRLLHVVVDHRQNLAGFGGYSIRGTPTFIDPERQDPWLWAYRAVRALRVVVAEQVRRQADGTLWSEGRAVA